MQMKYILCLVLILGFFEALSAKNIHVSPQRNNLESGGGYATIQAAIETMQPGDTCMIHTGVYRESVFFDQSGSEEFPLVIQAAKGETPILSGLDLLNLKWKKSDKQGFFVAPYKNDNFEQLFLNGKPMLEARWPNVPKDNNGDWNFFSPEVWAAVDADENNYGTIKDEKLMSTGWDVTGSLAILNVHHQYYVWSRTVESHGTGNDSFNYPKNLGSSLRNVDESGNYTSFNDDRYYLVGKKDFLNVPGEWYYDNVKKELFIYLPEGISPENCLLEVKTRNYGLTAGQKCNYITVDGITFYGTAFVFGKDYNNKSSHITFRNNKVLYSSWTEYFGLERGDSKARSEHNYPKIDADNCVVANNIFAYGAMSGLYINGFNNLIENNLFHDLNLNSSLNHPPLQVAKAWPDYIGKGAKATIRYNTIYHCGGIATQFAQADNDVYMNDVHHVFRACWGGNKDQSALYTQNVFCQGTRIHHNWVYDSYAGDAPHAWGGGMGIRGDDHTVGLTIDHNVVWNIGSAGIELKTPDNPGSEQMNSVLNNTIFQHSAYNAEKNGIIVQTLKNQNRYSVISNNLSESICGHWFGKSLGVVAQYSNNITGKCVEEMLESPTYFDFRLKLDVKNVGAYERDSKRYWIPGRRENIASFPIVPNNATVASNRDVLMFKPAYNAIEHHIYFGTSPQDLQIITKLIGEENVISLPILSECIDYFWRVDALMPDGAIRIGDVWRFTIKNN